MKSKLSTLIFLDLLLLTIHISAQNLQITSITPAQNQNNVNRNANITIGFDQTINGATLNDSTIIVRGIQSGRYSGIYYYQLVAGDYKEVKKMVLVR